MSISRKDVKEIIAIAEKHKGKISWHGFPVGWNRKPMRFRYIFTLQKTQMKCRYEFYHEKWQSIHITVIPRGRKYDRYVCTSYKDTLIISQLLAHLREITKGNSK